MSDKFDLQRFVDAQEPVYPQVRAELADGHKRSHWMWFIFPQIAGLGQSAMARRYAISSLEEGRAYVDHAVLGARLLECSRLVLAQTGRSAHDIFGSPDDMKLHSSMTLFHKVAPEATIFQQVIAKYYAGSLDQNTLMRL